MSEFRDTSIPPGCSAYKCTMAIITFGIMTGGITLVMWVLKEGFFKQ